MTDKATHSKLEALLRRYHELGIAEQIDHEKFYLYSIVTHSTAIEGSTVTEVENQLLFDEGIAPAGRALVEQLMNLDLKDAYVQWLKWAKGDVRFTTGVLCQMSASVMRRTGSAYSTLQGDFDSSRGDIRKVNVRAGANGRSYMAFQKVPPKLEAFCLWLNESIERIDPKDAVAVYRLSFAAHYRLVTIHPWVDGNGRTTRMLMNILQSHFGVPMSKVQKKDKAEYIQALIDAREAGNENMFIDTMTALHCADLEWQIRHFEEDVSLEENVHANTANVHANAADVHVNAANVHANAADVHVNSADVHANVHTKQSERQKRIIQLLSAKPASTIPELASLLDVNEKTIRRDLATLRSLGVVRREGADKNGRWLVDVSC